MIRSESILNIATAMLNAQKKIDHVVKTEKAKVILKSGADMSYEYANLPTVIDAIKIHCNNEGVFFTQVPIVVDGIKQLDTLFIHAATGEYIGSRTDIVISREGAQEYGSALTYLRRYVLCSMVGISPEKDDDGELASKKKLTPPKQAVAEISQSFRKRDNF